MKIRSGLHELVAATHTPFHDDGTLAPGVVPVQAGFLAANGIKTVFITGSTGECHSLTVGEKLEMYEAWAAAAPEHDISVLAHVGGNCLEDSKKLARHAQGHGFRAISAMAPGYYKPGNVGDLVSFCASIAAAAPELPFYYYDIPSMTGVKFPVETFIPAARDRIPTFAGVKFTNPDTVSYLRCLETAGPQVDLPWGVDEMLLSALACGATGGVGSTYNWAPELYRKLIAAFRRGEYEEARRLQHDSIRMIDAIGGTGYFGTAKALMVRLGVPMGPARAPLGNPAAAQVDNLMERLDQIGFAEWGGRPPASM
jgi:N-acetylneuraminate lyase